MCIKSCLLSLFLIILICCTRYCESGLHESNKYEILDSSLLDMRNVLFSNGEYRDLSLNYSNTDEKECKCKDGRCEKVCAEWKDGACLRTKLGCVCDPEFVKADDQTCIYCGCGKGFNCTYDRNSRTDFRICTCPEGYYDYGHECAPFCSESRPCQNGGTCNEGKCKCKYLVHGPFCERIGFCAYECRPRLTVDCVYIQEEETYGCLCKNRSLFFDYGEWLCKPCPCGEGTCKYEKHELKCDCKPGYKAFLTQCKKCDCGPGHECEIGYYSGEKTCKCQNGFFEREGTCLPCECGHEKATCSLDNVGRKICKCPEGYEDILGLCEKPKVNCTCQFPTENCVETEEGFDCVCKDGYMRNDRRDTNSKEPCIDIDECSNKESCPKSNNQKCVNFPGSYMCQCEDGFEPVSGTADSPKITCEKYKPSWLPTGITIAVIVVFISISVAFIVILKKKESSRLTMEMPLRFTR